MLTNCILPVCKIAYQYSAHVQMEVEQTIILYVYVEIFTRKKVSPISPRVLIGKKACHVVFGPPIQTLETIILLTICTWSPAPDPSESVLQLIIESHAWGSKCFRNYYMDRGNKQGEGSKLFVADSGTSNYCQQNDHG